MKSGNSVHVVADSDEVANSHEAMCVISLLGKYSVTWQTAVAVLAFCVTHAVSNARREGFRQMLVSSSLPL